MIPLAAKIADELATPKGRNLQERFLQAMFMMERYRSIDAGWRDAAKVIESLDQLGAAYHADLLRAAFTLWQKEDRRRISSADDFVEEALEEEFSDLDRRFHEAPTPLVTVLEDYLRRFQHHFVIVT